MLLYFTFPQMVTSFNNVALCELNLKKYKDAIVAANNVSATEKDFNAEMKFEVVRCCIY